MDSADLSRAIQEIGRSAFRSPRLSDYRKHAIALQLDFLASEADEPQEQRNAAIFNPVLNGLQLMLGTSADMLQAWSKWGPTLVEFFNQAQKGSSPARARRFPADAA
jgi:hypothetical protein